MNENLKGQSILPVREKGSSELNVANVDRDGKVKQAKSDGKNPYLLKINKYGNILENFVKNFMCQVKKPTCFEFFRVLAEKFKEVVQKLQDAFKNPEKPENKTFIKSHRINLEDFLKEQGQMQEQTQTQLQVQLPEKSYVINPEPVHWDKVIIRKRCLITAKWT
jgi:predicted XRE-type DNA-binding protein